MRLLFVCCVCAACGTSAPDRARRPRDASDPRAPAAPTPAIAPQVPESDGPELGADADFGDLVRTAAARMGAGDAGARAECLLRVGPRGYALDAELMPALHELPEPLAELDAGLLRARGPIRVLTAWGQLGAIHPALGLAAFTALPPQVLRASAVAVIATERGVYLRYSDAHATDADGPLELAAVVPRLLGAHAGQPVLFVSAEAGVPVAQLAALLRALPHGRSVALAQVLPPGTRLPQVSAPQAVQTCPDGLPEPAADSAEGALDPQQIVDSLGPLRAGASACLASATAEARAGGRLVLALRIGADGAVQDACLLQDGIADAALAACVLQSARALRLPPPDPPGFVDVHVPLALTPQSPARPQALCE